MLDAFAAACVEMAVISGTAAGLSGRPHAQHSSAAENWSRLHLDSAQLEGILESHFSGHHAQVLQLITDSWASFIRIIRIEIFACTLIYGLDWRRVANVLLITDVSSTISSVNRRSDLQQI